MKIHCHYRDYVLISPHLLLPRYHRHYHHCTLSTLEEKKEQYEETVNYKKKGHGREWQYLDAVLSARLHCIIERIWNHQISFCTSKFKAISSLLTLNGPRSTWSWSQVPLHNFLMSIFSHKVTNAPLKAKEGLQKCKQNRSSEGAAGATSRKCNWKWGLLWIWWD